MTGTSVATTGTGVLTIVPAAGSIRTIPRLLWPMICQPTAVSSNGCPSCVSAGSLLVGGGSESTGRGNLLDEADSLTVGVDVDTCGGGTDVSERGLTTTTTTTSTNATPRPSSQR